MTGLARGRWHRVVVGDTAQWLNANGTASAGTSSSQSVRHSSVHSYQCKLFGLTDTEWDVEEPLRTTSSLAVTTFRVPTFKIYISYTCRASWRGDCGLRLRIERSWVRVSAAVVWLCVLGQDTSPVCAFSRPRSEWVPGWAVIVCVFELR